MCPYSLSLPGGVQGQVLGLARSLRGLGVEARILGPCDGPPPDTAVTPLGKSIPMASNGSMAAIAPDLPATLRTIRALRDEAFDVVHIHEPFVPGPPLIGLVFCESPMVGTFHRSGDDAWYRRFKGAGVWASRRLGIRAVVSEEAEATVRSAFGGTYELVWNGLDAQRFATTAPWAEPAGRHRPTVMFVGRHEERKGLAVLLAAMGHLDADIRCWVVGEGPETANLRAASAGDSRVEWLGPVGEDEKVARMLVADVFCAPSLAGESFGVVLLEGMAAGCVVVASDLPGYRQVARPGLDADLVPPGDVVALAAAVRHGLAGGPHVEAMVRSGLERAAGYSMDNLARRYLEMYRRLAPNA